MQEQTVYIVHCVDTEGPLYESPFAVFERIRDIFGVDIEPSQENLALLQEGALRFGGKEDGIKELADIHRASTKGDWRAVDKMLEQVTSESFRMRLPDSEGKGWIFNWFCMDHVGFCGANPRRRDVGHHKIFDHYQAMAKRQGMGDFIGFHYHPVPISGNYHESGTAYWGSGNLNQILARKIIERGWFPTAFRPGFHTERPDSHWFLEQWIPFDFGNQSKRVEETGQPDLADGRFGDWRRAPLEWFPYHPSHDDYQERGTCRRWIARCLNMYARVRQIGQEDVDAAFEQAREGGASILAFTDHDYKDMEFEVTRLQGMIKKAHSKYPEVRFEYATAVEAMRKALKLPSQDFRLEGHIEKGEVCSRLAVETDSPIFGPQPFLAIKTKTGKFIWENFDVSVFGRRWSYTFDANTIHLDEVETIGVAANNGYGIAKVLLLSEGKEERYAYHV